jgi:hypothetical protein
MKTKSIGRSRPAYTVMATMICVAASIAAALDSDGGPNYAVVDDVTNNLSVYRLRESGER